MTPLELLQSELSKWTKALRKSKESYEKGDISFDIHQTHKNNLEPKIIELSGAIEILKKGLEKR